MEVYTIQMSQWRVAKELGITLIDTTVKSGVEAFAPTWPMVYGIKNQTLSEEEYRRAYIDIIRRTWRSDAEEWEKLLSMDRVALACYCKAGAFCHRHILKEAVINVCNKRGIGVTDGGELNAH